MKLVSDYRIRFEYFMAVYFLPLALYYHIFRTHIRDLLAGGIIFVYLTMILAFANRYVTTCFTYYVAKKMGKNPSLYLKTLNPRAVPSGYLTTREVRRLEILPGLMVLAMIGGLTLISYGFVSGSYLTKVLLGTTILTSMIFWRQWKYLLKTVEYRGHYFQYNKRTVKIYNDQKNDSGQAL